MTEAIHIPVLLAETLEALRINPDGVYLDGTFGRGGHAQAIMARLSPKGRLIVVDKDPEAIAVANTMAAHYLGQVTVIHGSFADARQHFEGEKFLDGVLLDLGVSSPQVDVVERGFSYRFDAALDMRMNNSQGITAAQWLLAAEENEIKAALYQFAEERHSAVIAKRLVARRKVEPINTTAQLVAAVCEAVAPGPQQRRAIARTFQAVRIAVNQELSDLEKGLKELSALLKEGGVMAVISFHSLEDRIVKQFFKGGVKSADDVRWERLFGAAAQTWRQVVRVFPGQEELRNNKRASSSVLRAAVYVGS